MAALITAVEHLSTDELEDLPALAGAAFIKAIRTWSKNLPFRCRRADALALLRETYLKHGPATQTTAHRYQVVVHVDAETLRHAEDGRCQLEDGPPIPIATARRIACDSSLVRITEIGLGEILDVGRKTRSISPALRRALKQRDNGCQFPGCTYSRYVDTHHIKHWADSGETNLPNLITLCRAHHRMVHSNEIVVESSAAAGWIFLDANRVAYGSSYQPRPTPFAWTDIRDVNEDSGVYIDGKTAVTGWSGERMDYHLAMSGLFTSIRLAEHPEQAFSRERFGGEASH